MNVPVTQVSLLRVLGEDAQSPRWTEFAAKYASMIDGFLYKYHPTVDKDEVVDDVLLTLVRKLPVYRYDPDVNGHFRNFLIGIVNNKAREYKRKRMREAEKRDAYGAEAQLSWEHERQSYAVDLRNWMKDASEVALTQFMADPKVSTRDKEIFRRIVLCGQTPDEVATLFGIERNNVDQIKSRMRKKLMELVEQYRQVGCEGEK